MRNSVAIEKLTLPSVAYFERLLLSPPPNVAKVNSCDGSKDENKRYGKNRSFIFFALLRPPSFHRPMPLPISYDPLS